MKKFLCLIIALVVISIGNVTVFAQSYEQNFPSYVPVSGGAWVEIDTPEGVATIVVPIDYLIGSLGFTGTGYQLTSVINSTINGTIYHSTHFDYYGEPEELQCRFERMSGLEVYVPYRSTGGYTSYRWEPLSNTTIENTNIDFVDDAGLDRQNDYYRYTTDQKLLILVFVSVVLIGLFMIFRRMWSA